MFTTVIRGIHLKQKFAGRKFLAGFGRKYYEMCRRGSKLTGKHSIMDTRNNTPAGDKGLLNKIRKIGITATIFDWLFSELKFLPFQVLIEQRAEHQNRIQNLSKAEQEKATLRRSILIESIIFCYILFYIIVAIFISQISHYLILKLLVLLLLTFRLVDIIQVNVNISVFDNININTKKGNIDTKEKTDTSRWEIIIFSSIRSVVLVSLNFIEIAVIFGFYYSLIQIKYFKSDQPLTCLDTFYYSFITQLTIGYGDITPLGFNRFLSIFQGLMGYFFSILILSRFIGLLPPIKSERH